VRFGGHETFTVREGWLSKGLRLVDEEPDKLSSDRVADWLGVGRNMAKSIRHWLLATGLCEAHSGMQLKKRSPLRLTEFGQVVLKHDPYFADIGTWWVLHTSLISSAEYAYSWDWFFNRFGHARFDKAVCVEGLTRYLQMQTGRMPSPKTLDRDVSCLLQSYSRAIPEQMSDPEDARESPFRELGLLSHYRASGYYQVDQSVKVIPAQIFCYMLTRGFGDEGGSTAVDVSVHDAAQRRGGPGRALCLTAEGIYELAVQIEAQDAGMQIGGLAGERRLQLERRDALEWLREYYTVCGMVGRHAA
jgi:hypothetical protein